MKSRLLVLMVPFFLAANPVSVGLGQASNPTTFQNVIESGGSRESQLDRDNTEHQKWRELLKKATSHQDRLNADGCRLLDGWLVENNVNFDTQIQILVALRKELESLLQLLQRNALGEVRGTAFRGSALDSGRILGSISALKIAWECAEITKTAKAEITRALLTSLADDQNNPWQTRIMSVRNQMETVCRQQRTLLISLERVDPYYQIRDLLKKEKIELNRSSTQDVVRIGAELKRTTLESLEQGTADGTRIIDRNIQWDSTRPGRDPYRFEQDIWGVPKFEEIHIRVRTNTKEEPQGSYSVRAYVDGMKERHGYDKTQENRTCIYLWNDRESYAVAGKNLCGTVECVSEPSSPEVLQLEVSLGYGKVVSAKPLQSYDGVNKASDYLINVGLYLTELQAARLEFLDSWILEVSAKDTGRQEVEVGSEGIFEIEITNKGDCDISELWLDAEIIAPDGKKRVETTHTLSPNNPGGRRGGILFNFDTQGHLLRQGRSSKFRCSYRFNESAMGHKYEPGSYRMKYSAWSGSPEHGLQLIEPQEVIITIRPGTESTAFPKKPDIRITQFSQEPYPVELDTEVELIFAVQNQSDSPLKAGHLEWWVCNKSGDLMKKFERTGVTMGLRESEQFSESIMLTSRNKGGRYTAGTYKVLFSACMPSPDIPDAELVVGNECNLTFQVLISRGQIAANIRELIDTIEARETEALPRIREEERRQAEERRREEELELQIAEYYRRLNEEEDARVRRELEEASDRLTQALLAMANEHQQRRNAAGVPPPIQPQTEQLPNTPRPSVPEPKVSDGPLTVKIWTVPKQLSVSELWRTSRIDVTLYYAASTDCDVEIYSQFDRARFGWFTGAKLEKIMPVEGGGRIEAYSSPGGGAWSWSRLPPSRVIAHHVEGGRTYSHNMGSIVVPDVVYQHFRGGVSERPKLSERIQVQCQSTITIRATKEGKKVSDSIFFRVVP